MLESRAIEGVVIGAVGRAQATGEGLSVAPPTVEQVRPVTDLQRKVAPFEVITDMTPSGDQPTAIAELERRVKGG